jgi:hypothetical protein
MHADWSFIVLGGVGGLIPDVLRLIKGRYKAFPGYLRERNFWLGLLLLVLLGGLAAWAFQAHDAKAALAYGFGAPQVFSTLVSSQDQPAVRGDGEFDLRRWWAS